MESYLTALLLERGWSRWSRKEISTLPVCPGLEISLTVTPDLSPGERKAEGVFRAKGQVISWSVIAEVKPARVVLQTERTALKSEQEEDCSRGGRKNMSIS